MDKGKRGKGDAEDLCISYDKTEVLQEAKQYFMATSVKKNKLIDVLTKCIYIVYNEDNLTSTEATNLFFHITRLFQYKDKDNTLKRLIYIGIKALSHRAENVYVVTSSLITDVNSSRDDPAVRALALRTLCQISDASSFTSIERLLRQCIVDKHPVMASAALTSLISVAQVNPEIVRRCTNEIQEALTSPSQSVQYHALCLRYVSCKNDRLSTSRLLTTCIGLKLKSIYAIQLLLRIIQNYINDYPQSDDVKRYIHYVCDCMNHRSELVEYQAADTLVNITKDESKIKEHKISSVVLHLRNFLTASKPALRFGGVRSLNKLASVAPKEVAQCNLELEQLISQSDCNRDIALLAITTLLKTGTESSVDKFLKQIGEFLSEIDDDFKVVVVGSIRQLCQKYPSKHAAMMDFLSNMLREEGGYAYKKAIVDTLIRIIKDHDLTKYKGLEQLCEFIEDCEHDSLTIEVLIFLGSEGPKTKKASSYIRYIANRLLLDSPAVGCAAITALAKFGAVPELRENILVALERFSLHKDWDVMESAGIKKGILRIGDESLIDELITNPKPNISLPDLENSLLDYLEGDCEEPFDLSNVTKTVTQSRTNDSDRDRDIDDSMDSPVVTNKAKVDRVAGPPPVNVFENIAIGDLIKTSESSPLTDSVSEFGVRRTIHIYQKHIIFQFDCTNTVDSMCLENVGIEMEAPPGFSILASTECPSLAFQETAPIYSCVELVDEVCLEANYFTDIKLKYNYRNVNPQTQEIDDEINEDVFPLEDMLIDLTDYLSPEHIDELTR
jgi:coatomer protein complex subunit gamma